MDGFDIGSNGMPTGTITGETEVGIIQFSNNLDGILRDSSGNPIRLDPRDYRHQAYYGEERNNTIYSGKVRRYVFKGGVLVEMYDHCNGAVRDF